MLYTDTNHCEYRHIVNEKWRQYRGTAYEEYRTKWYEYPSKQYVCSFPLHMDLDVTNSCNLKCTMCPRTIMHKQGTLPKIGFMNFEFFKHLIDEGVIAGLASVKFNFQGEPLLHPQLTDMIRYAKNAGIIDTMINTNGTLLSEEKSNDLLDAGLDNIFFSIDAPHKETYEHIRIGANYDKVIDNIEQFITLKNDKRKRHVQIGACMVLLKDNINEIEDFKKLWHDKVDTIILSRNQHSAFDIHKTNNNVIPKYCCTQLWQRILVMWDGICIPCCIDSKKELVVGNAMHTSIQEIWSKSPLYNKLRSYHSSGLYHKIDLCNHCAFPTYDSTHNIYEK